MIDISNAVLRARSFAQLFEKLKEAQSRLMSKSDPSEGSELWYRGLPKMRYELKPSLFRFPHGRASESVIYKEFLEHGTPRETDWQTLFQMQHYFIPTRLLDWTTSLGVALHFALNSDDPLDNPVIWILHPGMLNRRALPKEEQAQLFPHGTIEPLTIQDLHRIGLGYHDAFISGSLRVPDLPLGITAEAAFDRLRAQRGRFTVHGKNEAPLEHQCPEFIQRIIVSNMAVEEIRERISLTGFDALSIFPDFVGLADFLRRRHGLTHMAVTNALVRRLSELWKSDHSKLEARTPTSISGIENCAVGKAYVTRSDANAVEAKLQDWIDRDEGGICIVTGAAGSGKTNCLLNLVIARQLYEQRSVIWFPLFRFDPREGFLRNLHAFLGSVLDQPERDWSHALIELCRKSDTIIVLDGLDELSRTKGRECAAALAKCLKLELRLEQKSAPDVPKVLVSCRQDIFNTLKGELGLPEVEILEPVEPLNKDAIIDILKPKAISEELLEFLAQYPVFLRFVRHSPLQEPMPSNPTKLFEALMPTSGTDKSDNLRMLGKIAKEMLARRQDYLSPEIFEQVTEGMQCEHFFGPLPMQVLLREKNTKDVRFLHHTIREFVLAWNIHASLNETGPLTSDWDLLLEQSDLDYEGAEVHRSVMELGSVPNWAAVREKWAAISERRQKNNFGWCSFESAGMLGVQGEQRSHVLRWIREVLSGTLDGKDRQYSFKTKYNAVRCLERLHPSAPISYCEWIVDIRKRKAIPSNGYIIDAYAVRGFQRSQLEVKKGPFFVLGTMGDATADVDQQEEFSQLLLERVQDLLSYAELSCEQFHVLINLTYALIRWYSPKHVSWLEGLLHDGSVLDPRIEANIRLARWLWHPTGEHRGIQVVDARIRFLPEEALAGSYCTSMTAASHYSRK